MRLRTARGKIKIEHRILPRLQRVLERVVERNARIRSVIPGVIRKVRDARGPIKIRVTVPTGTGWKAIALSAGERQELFVNTSLDKSELEESFRQALAELE